jgi:starch phosphorylase
LFDQSAQIQGESTLSTNPPSYTDDTADLLARLRRLAANLWWTWNQECQDIFQELSPRGWQDLYHNTVVLMQDISESELRVRLLDPDFARRVRAVLTSFDSYMNQKDTWAFQNAPSLVSHPVA